MKKINKVFNLILPIITIAFLLLVWQLVAKIEDNEFIVPTIQKTLRELGLLFGEKKFYIALGGTLLRSVIAFLVSFFVSAILAYCASKRVWAEKVILPVISITRTLPTIAIAWLFLFWTDSQIAPVLITMLVVLPTSYTQIKSALDCVNKNSTISPNTSTTTVSASTFATSKGVAKFIIFPKDFSVALKTSAATINLKFKAKPLPTTL